MSSAAKLVRAMRGLRNLMTGTKAKPLLAVNNIPRLQQTRKSHGEEFSKLFDNMPFSVTNRYALTVVYTLFFGVPFWAPFILLYYMYLKKVL